MSRGQWVWMPHPAHFICAHDCRFHLATKVGDVIVSTVGEYLPDSNVRDILAESRGITLEGMGDDRLRSYMEKIGYEDIGFGRKFETMVFQAKPNTTFGELCCPWLIVNGNEIDFASYNDAEKAYLGHMELCDKYDSEKELKGGDE